MTYEVGHADPGAVLEKDEYTGVAAHTIPSGIDGMIPQFDSATGKLIGKLLGAEIAIAASDATDFEKAAALASGGAVCTGICCVCCIRGCCEPVCGFAVCVPWGF